MWHKLNRCYPPQLELVALCLLILAFYIALSNYSNLPDTIPTHFDGRGIPDGWGSRSMIFLWPGIGAAMYVLFTSLNVLFATAKDPRRFINLPQARKATLTDAQTQELRTLLNRCLFSLKVLILGATVYGVHITVEIAWQRTASLGMPFYLFIAAILVVVGFMIWKSLRIIGASDQPHDELDV